MNCPPPGTIAGEAKTGTEGGAGVVFTIVAGEDGLVVLGGPAEAGGGGAPSHSELPALDVEPAGQSSHVCAPACEYLPASQARQIVAAEEEYVPALQSVHTPMEAAPSTAEYAPALHG